MTETNSEAITVTDAQVDTFFESNGEKLDSQPEIEKNTEEKATQGQEPKKDIQPDGDKKDDKSDNKVNYGALHEERMRRKEAAERAKKAEERAAALEEQLKRYSQPQVNEDDDPIESVRRENQQIKQVLIAQAQKALSDKQNSEYWGKVAQSEQAFKQDKPDFDDAAKFLAESRIKELTQHIGFSEQEASKILADEIKWISDKAYADEVNPAERFYNLALARGFKATPKQVDTTITDKLDRIEKGIKSNRALPPASKSVNQDLTAEALADMNVDALSNLRGETDFDKAWKKLFG